jgi:hypothetical protein
MQYLVVVADGKRVHQHKAAANRGFVSSVAKKPHIALKHGGCGVQITFL